jgi:hypothetical protein
MQQLRITGNGDEQEKKELTDVVKCFILFLLRS